jgi:hypothetical protein
MGAFKNPRVKLYRIDYRCQNKYRIKIGEEKIAANGVYQGHNSQEGS